MTTAKTETKTTAAPKTRAKKTGESTSGAEFSAFTLPKMDMPTMEVPAAVREIAEKGVEQFREAYDRMRSAAEESTDLIEDSYETSRQGMVELNLRALEAAKSNTDAAYSFMRDMFGVKTLSQAIELQTSYARKQFEALSGQTKDIQELAAKMASDAGEPVKDAVEKMFKDIKAA
ncbi:phasin [Breoghania sp. L-A4]|uniref:phasin n=1 Tax=Breoghania sp. L-A4 TaxID=2304600 RepID=UPI000E35ECE3|nr:phasin [Breoghania sp. L-A4]AXS39367.1 phasin [Breoghania sp. L-A4]